MIPSDQGVATVDPTQPAARRHQREMDLLEQRHELIERLRNCRYLHRLVRSHFDLTVARATMTDDFLLMTELLTDPNAPDQQLLRSVISNETVISNDAGTGAPGAGPTLSELSELLQQFAAYERGLVSELDDLTHLVVERLRDCPTACLPQPALTQN